MILNTTSEATNNSGLVAGSFQIKATAQAFKILSSSLYTYKERAVLRELAANALDSHTVAGIPNTPIEITLPTQLEPTLIVKDFGTGMSLQVIQALYFTFFASDKDLTNDVIGGFGLTCN